MAGIGWRLERLIESDSLAGAAAAYATGAAVMALPWLATTAVLAALRPVLGWANTLLNTAYAVALLVGGPVQIVLSRHAADRIYERRLTAIAAPFRRGVCAALAACGLCTAVALLALGVPASLAFWGAALSAAVGAQWTALSVGNGLCSPSLVLGSVAGGACGSLALAAGLGVGAGLGVPGCLFGLAAGQCLTLGIVLAGVMRALPAEADESEALAPAFREYAALAVAGLAYNASLWVDKLVVRALAGPEAAALHSTSSTAAWLAIIPGLAWIFVEVETSFHRRYQAFYSALKGGSSLAELREKAQVLASEGARLLRGATEVQTSVAVLLVIGAERVGQWLGLPPEGIWAFRLLVIGVSLQTLTLLGLILLYYFDLRRDALMAAAGVFFATAALTAAAIPAGLPPSAGTAVASCLGAVFTWRRVDRGIHSVLADTLLCQPFGSEV
ncbi:MAG TPA: exopolysaccharide Pel transporter PelG [Myxococcaceae bacterium]|nr:exopolysaccharide Pel transporter PelG [Myxococcaceae bacterium]